VVERVRKEVYILWVLVHSDGVFWSSKKPLFLFAGGKRLWLGFLFVSFRFDKFLTTLRCIVIPSSMFLKNHCFMDQGVFSLAGLGGKLWL